MLVACLVAATAAIVLSTTAQSSAVQNSAAEYSNIVPQLLDSRVVLSLPRLWQPSPQSQPRLLFLRVDNAIYSNQLTETQKAAVRTPQLYAITLTDGSLHGKLQLIAGNGRRCEAEGPCGDGGSPLHAELNDTDNSYAVNPANGDILLVGDPGRFRLISTEPNGHRVIHTIAYLSNEPNIDAVFLASTADAQGSYYFVVDRYTQAMGYRGSIWKLTSTGQLVQLSGHGNSQPTVGENLSAVRLPRYITNVSYQNGLLVISEGTGTGQDNVTYAVNTTTLKIAWVSPLQNLIPQLDWVRNSVAPDGSVVLTTENRANEHFDLYALSANPSAATLPQLLRQNINNYQGSNLYVSPDGSLLTRGLYLLGGDFGGPPRLRGIDFSSPSAVERQTLEELAHLPIMKPVLHDIAKDKATLFNRLPRELIGELSKLDTFNAPVQWMAALRARLALLGPNSGSLLSPQDIAVLRPEAIPPNPAAPPGQQHIVVPRPQPFPPIKPSKPLKPPKPPTKPGKPSTPISPPEPPDSDFCSTLETVAELKEFDCPVPPAPRLSNVALVTKKVKRGKQPRVKISVSILSTIQFTFKGLKGKPFGRSLKRGVVAGNRTIVIGPPRKNGRVTKLKPGVYRIVIVAIGPASRRSVTKVVTVRITK